MPTFTDADTIRILVATDNHVGYNERDPIRGEDSWKSFHEALCIAKERDVDMVLLAGDLFHDNKPSRKAMYEVMRTLRMNCYGEKPCELELLSDASETFAGPFNHVNYEDPDINVAIPVFSIHGNHDDPSGEGHYAALDILQMSGLLNYYGRIPESDNIAIKPILLQKGRTKLALYGMSNVRDERLFRTFRDGQVKFFQPSTQKDDWFNIMSVHQNRHAYTETGYLPEHFLPSFMDLVIWGHEHECKIDPSTNPETQFKVMQPGSSVATSLVPGESVTKHIAILTIKGKTFHSENVRLKSVRPFVMEEITLSDFPEMQAIIGDADNRGRMTRFLEKKVEELIEKANDIGRESRGENSDGEEAQPPLPLVRLRVEYSAFDDGDFYFENPQRFSKRFVGRVANTNDVVQFHRKRSAATRTARGVPDMPEDSVLAQLNDDDIKVERLVQEFLEAQSLSVLPQNSFSDAVGQFVDKDDKHAMEMFVQDSLHHLVNQLVAGNQDDEADESELAAKMELIKRKMEAAFARGELKRSVRQGTRKPKPAWWDSDMEDRHWEDAAESLIRSEEEPDADDDDGRAAPASKSKASGTSGKKTAAAKTAKKKPAVTAKSGRSTKKSNPIEEESDEDDVIMLDDDDDDDVLNDDDDDEEIEEEDHLFVSAPKKAPAKRATTTKAPTTKGTTTAKKPAASRATTAKSTTAKSSAKPAAQPTRSTGRQATLPWGSSQSIRGGGQGAGRGGKSTSRTAREPSDDEISDDDAFEPPPPSARRAARR